MATDEDDNWPQAVRGRDRRGFLEPLDDWGSHQDSVDAKGGEEAARQ